LGRQSFLPSSRGSVGFSVLRLTFDQVSPAGLATSLHKKIKGASAVKLSRPLLIEP
jgi:hypothetical protein